LFERTAHSSSTILLWASGRSIVRERDSANCVDSSRKR
jgi:hypothetical protein